jgi:hypothetical protein
MELSQTLRNCHLYSYSRISQHCTEPEGSLPCSLEPSNGTPPQTDQPSSMPSNPVSLELISILSFHLCLGLPSRSLLLALPPISHKHSSSPHPSHMLRPSHIPWLDNSNYAWRRIQVTKLFIPQCLIPFGSNTLPSTGFLKYAQSTGNNGS